ncbi:MAG: nucleotidyltransferase family protein [Anaerolineae bacterium]
MPPRVPLDRKRLGDFCRRWHITEFAFFGSVLRDDFRPDSDIDVLVAFAPESGVTLFDLVGMQDELEGILGREVHLVSRRAIERSRNPLRRQEILSSAEVLDVA